MIVCYDCSAINGDAMNMNWAMSVKNEKVQNIVCKKCEGELRNIRINCELSHEIIILEESSCDTRRDS